MSKSVDQRIVEMKFENGKFKNDIKETIDSLEKLKKETDFSGVQDSAKQIDFSKITNEVDKVKLSFNLLDVVRAKIFDRIGEKILNGFESGLNKIPQLFKKTIDIMKSKGWSRAANLENATFQLEGLGIAWEKVGDQIDRAVSGTAYGLDSAAKAAAQLSASGVKIAEGWKFSKVINADVDEMERALGAISGIAAMTNSSYDDIANVFTDAAGRGKVTADTFNRIAQRGLNSAATLAKAMGTTEEAVKKMASKGQISFQQFADAMYDAYYEQAKKSNETFDGALSNMQFALGKIGAEFAKPIRAGLIEPFNEVRQTINRVKTEMQNSGLFEYFTKLTTVLSKTFSLFVKNFRMNDENFKWVGNLAKAFENLVEVILRVAIPIKDAFKSVFGDSVIKSVNNMTKGFADFINALKPSAETANYIKIAFEGFFRIVKALGTGIAQLIRGITGINVEGTSLIGWIGKAIAVSLKFLGIFTEFVVKSTNIQWILENVTRVINVFAKSLVTIVTLVGGGFVLAFISAYNAIKNFAQAISTKIGSPSTNPFIILVREILSKIKEIPSVFPRAINSIKELFSSFKEATSVNEKFKVLYNTITKFKTKIADVIKNIGKSVNQLGNDSTLTRFISTIVTGIGVIVDNVGEFSTLVGSVIVASLGKAADSIKIFFTTFSNNMRKFNGNVIIAFWKTFVDGLKNFISNIPTAIEGIRIFFAELDILDKIKTKFANFVDFMVKAINYLKNSSGTLGVVTVHAAELNETVDNIAGSTSASKWDTSGIDNFINKIKEFVKNIDVGKLAVISFIAIITSVILQFRKFIKSLTTATQSITGVFDGVKKFGEKVGDSFGGLFGKIGESIKGYFDTLSEGAKHETTFNEVATALVKFAGAIAILTGSLMLLTSFMETHDVTKAGAALALLGVGILTFVGVLALMNKETELGFLIKFSAVLVVMAASMSILVKAMNSIDNNGIESRFFALSLLMGELALVTALLSKYAPELIKGSLSILTFAATLSVLAKALDKVPQLVDMSGEILILGSLLGIGAVVLGRASSIFAESLKSLGIAMAAIGAAALTVALTVALLNNIGDISVGLINLSEVLFVILAFSVIITQINKKLGQGELPKFNASMILLAGSVAILGLTAKMISKLNPIDFAGGVLAVGALMAFIAGLMYASQYTEKAHPVKFAAGLILITGCIGLMAGMAALIGLIKLEQLGKGIAVIGALELMVAGLMFVSKFTEKADFKSIMAALIGVNAIIVELMILSLIKDFTPVFKALGVISGVLISFGIMMAGIGKAHYSKNTPLALLAMIAIVAEIVGALYLLSTQVKDYGALVAASVSISAVLLSFGKTMKTVSSLTGLKPAKMGSFLLGTLALIPIAGALWAVANAGDWASILVAGTAVSLALITYAGVLKIISSTGKIDIGQIGGFLLGTLSLIPIALAIASLAKYDWLSMLSAAGAMSLTLLAVATALMILSGSGLNSLAGAGSLLIVSGGLILMAQAFQKMQLVEWETLGKAGAVIAAMAAAILLLGATFSISAIGAIVLVALAVALDLVGLAMIAAAKGMQMFTPSLVILAGLPLAEIGNGLVPLAGGLSLLGLAGIPLTLGAIGLSSAALYMSPLAKGLIELSKVGDISHIPGPLALIGAAGLVLGAASPGMLLAGAAFKVLATGITILGTAVSKAAVLISSGINLIVSTLKMGAANIKNNGQQIGVNVGAGMINGIKSSLPSVIKMAANLGTGVFESIKSALDIHSPSGKTDWAGQMTAIGFGNGVTLSSIWSKIKTKVTSLLNSSVLSPLTNGINTLKSTISGLGSAAERTNNPLDKLPTNVKNLAGRFVNASDNGSILDNVLHKLGFDALDMTDSFEEMTSGADGLTEALAGEDGNGGGGAAKAAETTKNAFEELKDKIAGQMDIFSEFERKTELTSDKLLANMQDQINGIAEWSKMMGDLAMRGINQGLLQKLADLGPQGYEYVHAFVTMTDEQLSQANQLYAKSLLMPEASANMIMNSFAHAGLWATQGFENGLDLQKFKDSGVKGAQAVRDGLEGPNGLQINSPSKVMYENGRYAIAGFVKGIDNQNKISLQPKMITIAKGVVSDIKREAGPDKFREIGTNIMRGLIDGIASKEGDLKTKVESIANTITGKFQKALQIHSPSRIMARLGGFVTEGLAIGIEGNTELVANASENLASTAISGLKDAIKAATNLTDLGIDLNPTITPVLDLSNIEAGSTQLDNLTNGWNNVGISTSSTLASSAANSFNKTSMAKASMALETQNGLSLLKSAINSLESRESDEKLDTIVGMMTEFMPLIGQGQVVLDTGATVGALAPRMDAELGRRASMRGRHV